MELWYYNNGDQPEVIPIPLVKNLTKILQIQIFKPTMPYLLSNHFDYSKHELIKLGENSW